MVAMRPKDNGFSARQLYVNLSSDKIVTWTTHAWIERHKSKVMQLHLKHRSTA